MLMSPCDYMFFLFPYISFDFCFMYLCFFVVNVSNGYDVYLVCELYLFSLKIFIFCFIKKKLHYVAEKEVEG